MPTHPDILLYVMLKWVLQSVYSAVNVCVCVFRAGGPETVKPHGAQVPKQLFMECLQYDK